MSTQSMYRCDPRQLRGYVKDCFYAGRVPFVTASPGVGKSAIIKSVAKELNLKVVDIRLSTAAPEDLSGMPEFFTNAQGQRRARFTPFEMFPLEGEPLPLDENGNEMEGWLIFFDEFNSAPVEMQAAAYKVILDRMVGQNVLHKQVAMCAAGNLSTDRAIVNSMSTAMQSRLVHLELEVSFEHWLYDVALPQDYDMRIVAYLSQYPSKLMDFRPDHQDKTFNCPRTWEFMNGFVKDQVVDNTRTALFAGTITSGCAIEFITFTKVFNTMVNIAEVIKDPSGCKVPTDNNSKWATIVHLIENVNSLNMRELGIYANRFEMTFTILFFRCVMVKQPALRHHPSFIDALQKLSQYLTA